LKSKQQREKSKRGSFLRIYLFPGVVLMTYAVLFMVAPHKTAMALKGSGGIFTRMAFPLCLVFIVMVLMDLFLQPGKITEFLGKKAGVKGLLLSATAGIISIGPIYAWYPLLKGLREKGAADFLLAVFLSNRAVKPFLIPIMISYFGWLYVLVLTFFTILGSIAVGYCVGNLVEWHLF